MTFNYKDVLPWGRNFDEYTRMFDLEKPDLKRKILGCGDGPASFNWECNHRGGSVTSVDPIYHLTRQEIENRIDETYEEILRQTELNKDKFVWKSFSSVEALGRTRMTAMRIFLESYDEGRTQRRYIPGALPDLPFSDKEFDVSLSSHFLFLYTDNLSYDFHVASINEMLRVSQEARIFPVLDYNGNKSLYLKRLFSDFRTKTMEIRTVNYEFQIGGNEVLIIRA